MMALKKLMPILLVLAGINSSFSQSSRSNFESCSTSPLQPSDKEKLAKDFVKWQSKANRQADAKYIIPVVFHLVEQNPTISDEEVQSIFSEINDAYAHRGSFTGVDGVDTQIEFCLAQRSPDGALTSGINRINSDYERFDMDLENAKMKTLGQWDPRYYLNIWIVEEVRSEIYSEYTGSEWWTRLKGGGFSSLPTQEVTKDFITDGIVLTSISAQGVAHEGGHYFGLLHTFAGGCKNDNCFADGDMVCDTPPDDSVFNSCEDNSCSTDTLSNYSNNNFFEDRLDMGTNFMDYGNGGCSSEFSAGQTERMHFHKESYRPLLNGQFCNAPCDVNLSLSFNQSIMRPLPNQDVTFNSTSENVDTFNWHVEYLGNKSSNYSIAMEVGYQPSSGVINTSPSLSHSFPAEGKYRVYLKAWNSSNPDCFVSYSKIVKVTCGVDARYSPDIRFIAAKNPRARFLEPVVFTNYSVGATSYEWTITHKNPIPGNPNLPVFTSNDVHLTYFFPEPGEYNISLKAMNGACVDVANTFTLQVEDPTIDGSPIIESTECYKVDSLLVELTIENLGYDTINVGTPIAFYNADPLGSNSQLIQSFELPEIVYGFESTDYSFVISNQLLSDDLYVVFNDDGLSGTPVTFPTNDLNIMSFNTEYPTSGYAELNYQNNIGYIKIEVDQVFFSDIYACEGDELDLDAGLSGLGNIIYNSQLLGEFSEDTITYVALADDVINVTWQNEYECKFQDAFEVIISEPRLVFSDTLVRINRGESVRLMASGAVTYNWSPPIWLDDPTSSSPLATPAEPIIYTLEAADSIGCEMTGNVEIEIVSTAHIPNLFTPNEDNSNDFLRLLGLMGVEDIDFRVFNRVGSLVFESNDVDKLSTEGWDGTWKGKIQPNGIYYWTVQGKYTNGLPILLNGKDRGTIHLVR
ncbi:MAG: gliding motility-associated C-terminal domain-containing protein [Fulvivirga sp.]|uniref:T9SS type B sorting domain-containing protein n=1 Tax=Fulvivirga sp. TaxID=1931237 RepID=UPI0032ED807D